MKKHLLLLLLIGLTSVVSYAQLSVTGEIRPRTELYNGNNSSLATKDQRFGVATQQRSRLYINYMSESGLKLVFSPQLVHFWGQMPQAYDLLGDGAPGGPEGNFSVFEAYAEYKFNDSYSLKAGRQAISYTDQRWFGALGWAASSRAHDAFVNKLSFGDVKLDVGVALNQTKHVNAFDSAANANIRAGYKSMQYAWLTAPAGDLTINAMATNVIGLPTVITKADGGKSPVYRNNLTFGFMPTFKAEDIVVNASAYYQTVEFDENYAYLLAADVTYKGAGIPITLGADIVSGTSTSSSSDQVNWRQPFGTNHKFYGLMDFFYVGETPAFGLNDFYAKTVIKTGEKSKIVAMPHVFTTNTKAGLSEGGYLGTEIDLVFIYQVASDFNFTLGYSKMFADELLEEFQGGDAGAGNQWAWMQLTFNPKFK